MAIGERQQGEIEYLRSALGVDELESRLAALEGNDEYGGRGLEERHSRGLAGMAKLEKSGGVPFSPEGEPDPEPEEDAPVEIAGVVNQDEVVTESNPASEGEINLDEYYDSDDLPDDYNDWTVNQLKAELADRGQPVSGTKAELVDRLVQGDREA